jgi:hypothetical protein
MKALNVDQPWAELIIRGRKTIELRKRRTQHRGLVAIRATQTVLAPYCREFGLDPEILAQGAVLGTVELIELIEMTPARFEELRDQHCSRLAYPGTWKWGWRLADPRPLSAPIRCGALPGMFTLPEEVAEQIIRAS